jgi:GNAT superfamily N-acetyltransferase
MRDLVVDMTFKRRNEFGKVRYGKYDIYDNKTQIGQIDFIIKNHIIILANIFIKQEYQYKGYGYKTVEYLLNHYKSRCIIGQTLYESKGFWNKCIKKYNGMRKNIIYCGNCSSSFIIPRQNIDNDTMYDLLELSYEIY